MNLDTFNIYSSSIRRVKGPAVTYGITVADKEHLQRWHLIGFMRRLIKPDHYRLSDID